MSGLARTLSKLGYCSRRAATDLARAGRVKVNGVTRRNPEFPIVIERDKIQVDGVIVTAAEHTYLMLNKPRGLVTTVTDELGRPTVYQCFNGEFAKTNLFPVGRLDKASEGLLLFTNDTQWAETITAPESHLEKVYHVHVDRLVDESFLTQLRKPVLDESELLTTRLVKLIRQGTKTSWLAFTLDEGRNRHIRRLCAAHQLEVLRLVRIQVGKLELGDLSKGSWRHLSAGEVESLKRSH